MARHYSTKDFFRQMPNALLERYFQDRGLFTDLDFTAMKESKPDALFTAWLALGEDQRGDMDAEFREIFEISCEKGFRAIIDEARWQLRDDTDALTALIESLSALPNHYHRAMAAYLPLKAPGTLQPCQRQNPGAGYRQAGLPSYELPHCSAPTALFR